MQREQSKDLLIIRDIDKDVLNRDNRRSVAFFATCQPWFVSARAVVSLAAVTGNMKDQ